MLLLDYVIFALLFLFAVNVLVVILSYYRYKRVKAASNREWINMRLKSLIRADREYRI